MDWATFTRWLANPSGIGVAAGALLSIAVEYVPAYDALQKKSKRVVFLCLCLAVPLGAAGLGVWTLGWPATWAGTFWPAVVNGVLAFGSGTVVHTRKLGRWSGFRRIDDER